MAHRLIVLSREAGVRGLFAGLGPRVIMTANLVSGQFLINSAIKDGPYSCFFLTPAPFSDPEPQQWVWPGDS